MNDAVTDDTLARAALKQDAKDLNLVEFWEERADIEMLKPRNKAIPFVWRWKDIEPRLRVASRTVPIEECERRALLTANPGLGGRPHITAPQSSVTSGSRARTSHQCRAAAIDG